MMKRSVTAAMLLAAGAFAGISSYFDDTFVFTNVATNTPSPAALPLFATGLGGLALLGWRKARKRTPA